MNAVDHLVAIETFSIVHNWFQKAFLFCASWWSSHEAVVMVSPALVAPAGCLLLVCPALILLLFAA